MRLLHSLSALIIFSMMLIQLSRAINAAELLMVESASCEWCEMWHNEIGIIYSKTPEGKYAPLKRIDIADFSSGSMVKIRLPNFTPTFVILKDGREVARIIGYPGEDFFWQRLQAALKKIGFTPKN